MNHFDELMAKWQRRARDIRKDPQSYYGYDKDEILEDCVKDLKDTLLLIEADKVRSGK